jgi:3-methylcrotonyl-CoA carboxylase beta subunit
MTQAAQTVPNWYTPLLEKLEQIKNTTKAGGGAKRQQALRDKGKLPARDRIANLLDPGAPSVEIGTLTADGMYKEEDGCPSAGVVVVVGQIHGRQVVVVANDATVKAGAWFPMTAKKNLRAQEIAMENRLPIVYLVDSAGVFLPLQHEVFADKDHFGRIFRNNAVMSAMGLIQIAAIMGSCVAGGAYLPIMSDEAFIVDGTGSVFLAGSYLVKAAVGEDIDNESLGGSIAQTEISGVTDNRYPDDVTCLDAVRNYFTYMADAPSAGFSKVEPLPAARAIDDLPAFFPENRTKPYDMNQLLEFIIDADSFQEYKPLYGKTIVCGYARVGGWAVGIVANQRKMVKTRKGEMQMGGVIYSDSADKAARFIMNCNQRKIPLLFIHDVTGFMVGSRSEQGGIIKDGAKMVNAMANSVVPKITLIVGNSFGAGNYAMCGKAYDPRFIFAWPSAQLAVMGAAAATSTIAQIQKSKLKGQEVSPDSDKVLLAEISANYERTMSPYYAASQLWVDDIITPAHTRNTLASCLAAVNCRPVTERYNVGVIQT